MKAKILLCWFCFVLCSCDDIEAWRPHLPRDAKDIKIIDGREVHFKLYGKYYLYKSPDGHNSYILEIPKEEE